MIGRYVNAGMNILMGLLLAGYLGILAWQAWSVGFIESVKALGLLCLICIVGLVVFFLSTFVLGAAWHGVVWLCKRGRRALQGARA